MVQRGKLFVIRVDFITNGAASSFQVSLRCVFSFFNDAQLSSFSFN